jgi:hypothetical protein
MGMGLWRAKQQIPPLRYGMTNKKGRRNDKLSDRVGYGFACGGGVGGASEVSGA